MSGRAENSTKDRRFWRALSSVGPCSAKPVDLTHDLNDLNDDQREHRRQALKSMLTANEARQQDVLRNKRPCLAIGHRVMITKGELAGRQGLILDADFIQNRVQLDVDELSEPQWLAFNQVGCI